MGYPEMNQAAVNYYQYTGDAQRQAIVQNVFAYPRPSIDAFSNALTALGRMTPLVQEAIEKAHDITNNYDFIWYIAGPLTGMSDTVKRRYEQAAEACVQSSTADTRVFGYAPHLHGTDPVKHPDVDKDEVRDIDDLWARIVPQGHLNFWQPTAHGNAVEAGWGELTDIPTLYIMPEAFRPSRLVGGMHNAIGALGYEDFSKDGYDQLTTFLGRVAELHTKNV